MASGSQEGNWVRTLLGLWANLCEAWIESAGPFQDLYLLSLLWLSPGALLVCVPTGVLALVVCSLSS